MNNIIDIVEVLRAGVRRGWLSSESETSGLELSLQLLGRADEATRCDGVRLLSTLGSSRAEELLLRSLTDRESPRMRSVAAIALGGRSTSETVARALMARLGDADEALAVRAASAWSLRGTTVESVLSSLWTMIDDANEVPALRELVARAVLEPAESPMRTAELEAAPSLESLPERTRTAIEAVCGWINQPVDWFRRAFQRAIEHLDRISTEGLQPSFGTFGRTRDEGRQRVHVEYFPGRNDPDGLPDDFEVPLATALTVRLGANGESREILVELDPRGDEKCRLNEVLGNDDVMSKLRVFMVVATPSAVTLGERDRVHLPAVMKRHEDSGRLSFVVTGDAGSVPTALRHGLAPSSACSIHIFAVDPIAFAAPPGG